MKKLSKLIIAIMLATFILVLVSCDSTEHKHVLVEEKETSATCISEGTKVHWHCTECDKLFSDAEGQNEISLADTVVEKMPHTLTKHDAKAATCLESGNVEYYECSSCGKYFSDEQATTEISKDSVLVSSQGHDFSERHQDSLSYWYTCSRCEAQGSRQPLDPNFTLPDLTVINEYQYTLGVGQRWDFVVQGDYSYAVYSWNTNVAKIEAYFDYGTVRGYYVYAVGGGETIISVVDANGRTVSNDKIVVVEDDVVRLGEGTLVDSIEISNTDATVYFDDTTVTYTVKTVASVDKLDFVQIVPNGVPLMGYYYDSLMSIDDNNIVTLDSLAINLNNLSDTFVNKDHGVRYSATRTVDGDVATWIVKWDLGATAVKYVRIVAQNSTTGETQTSYAHLNVVYPKFGGTDADFEALLDLYIKTNSTSGILYQSTKDYDVSEHAAEHFSKQSNRFLGYATDFNECFINTTVFGGNSIVRIASYGVTGIIDLSSMHVVEEWLNGKNVLCSSSAMENATMIFCYPISDELRAVWAYQHGYEIDKEKFPYAYDILQKAGAIIDEIIKDGMSDFEKEKAIYTWLYELGDGLQSGKIQYVDAPDGLDSYYTQKSSYGLFNKYGGDCMAYSGAFYTLCNMVGVECVTISLSTTDIGGAKELTQVDHRANVVKLGDEYYFVESFWSWQKSSDADGTYRYLNLNSKTAAKLYGWALVEQGGPSEFDFTTYLVDEQTGELLNKQI